MLSNAFASGKAAPQLISASSEQMAATLSAEVLTHTRVHAIDRDAKTIETSAGSIAYDKLVLALGADPIRLPLGGDAAGEVISVNHIDDYALLRGRIAAVGPAARIAIIGAGLIGCEFADDLVAGGCHVTLIDPNPWPLAALAAPILSEALVQAWSRHPITLRLGTTAGSIDHHGDALRVTLADGRQVDADIVLSAVGLRPSTALAQQARLATGRGIVVDAYGQTSAPDIYALGDCAEYTSAEATAVLPYVAPMLVAARAIAATLAGAPTRIELKTEAVIVKTASCRLALAPPAVGLRGEWSHELDAERIVARFHDECGVLRGFGITHHTPALRQGLLAALGIPQAQQLPA
jgi:rubredoxin-NAD+ reductase